MSSQDRALRRGWTTGTCATAAAKAAYAALLTGEFPDPVEVTLPRGERVSFALALTRRDMGSATAGVIKDAGDDPDVTHGALVLATVRLGPPGSGVVFRGGGGVGAVTAPAPASPPRAAGWCPGCARGAAGAGGGGARPQGRATGRPRGRAPPCGSRPASRRSIR